MQVTRNENHTPTAFHANVVAMEQGAYGIADIADDYVHCTQCGACELRCPNTLFTGDFYRNRTQTVKLVKAMRALAVDRASSSRTGSAGSRRRPTRRSEPVLEVPVEQDRVRDWAAGLDLPDRRRDGPVRRLRGCLLPHLVPRAFAPGAQGGRPRVRADARAVVLRRPRERDGLHRRARSFAEHNVADWRAIGARRIIAPRPARLHHLHRGLPSYFGEDYDFEVVHIIELVAELVADGRLELSQPVERVVTYHDPCRLNKRKGIHEPPRDILRAIPGLTFKDVDHVTQWSYCSGGGGGLPIEKPEITAEISRRRVDERRGARGRHARQRLRVVRAAALRAGAADAPLDVIDLIELVAQAAGIEVGGHARRRPGPGMTRRDQSPVDEAVLDELRAILGSRPAC